MTSIRNLFDPTKDIDRRIEKVITYNPQDEEQLRREVVEYVATDNIQDGFDRLLSELDHGMGSAPRIGASGDGSADYKEPTEIGVWVSGFYGSGKSSFTKYVGYALDKEVKIGERRFLDYLEDQFTRPDLKALVKSVAKRHDPVVIMIDLAAQMVAGNTTMDISSVLYNRVMQWAGYSRDRKISYLELMLERDGKLDNFRSRVTEMTGGMDWSEVKDQPLVANQIASTLAAEFYDQFFDSASAFNDLNVDEVVPEDERVREMIALIRRRSGKENIVFVLDEVGQYVAASDPLILNLDGLAKNLKAIGEGRVWILATAQQTLTEDDTHARYNSAKLFKLKDRFPIGIDMEGRDIREITYRRLLGKSADGEEKLAALFDSHGKELRLHTKLANTRYYKRDLDKGEFVRLYPFLPQHFDILLELLARLSRSTGGTGLRSAIRVIQDVLIGSASGRGLADAEPGALATTVTFYDTLRKDIQKSQAHIVTGVDRAVKAFGEGSLEVDVAKSIAVLQLLEDFPVSRENVAALMYPRLGSGSVERDVDGAVENLMGEESVTVSEIDGSLRFMNEAVADLDTQRRRLIPTKADRLRLLNARLKDLFTPLPHTSLQGGRRVRAGLKVMGPGGFVSVDGDKEEVQILVEMVPETMYEARRKELLSESTQNTNDRNIFLLAPQDTEVDRLLDEQWRSQRIYEDNRSKPASREVQDYLSGEQQRAARLAKDVERSLAQSLLKGVFVFRGQPTPAAQKSRSISEAAQAVLGKAAADIYYKYAEAPLQAESALAERFLKTAQLDRIASKDDPMELVKPNGQIDTAKPALQSVLSFVEEREHVEGRTMQDHFTAAPYAWSKDTVRYLVAALLTSGDLQLRVGGETIKVRGQSAVEALKSNQAFNRVGVSPRGSRPSNDHLRRAAERLLQLTGDKVLPLEADVSKAVTKHFPDYQQEYAALDVRLRELGLSGVDRARRLKDDIVELLKGDASDAASRLGPEECELYDDLRWAQQVHKALDSGIEHIVRQANATVRGIENLPDDGVFTELKQGTAESREHVASCLKRDTFFEHQSDLQNRLAEIDGAVQRTAKALASEHEERLDRAFEQLSELTGWSRLPEDDRQQLADQVDALRSSVPATLEGIKQHLNGQYHVSRQLASISDQAKQRIEALAIPSTDPSVVAEPDSDGRAAFYIERLEGVPRTLTSPGDIDLLIERLRELKARFDEVEEIQIEW